MRHQKYYIKLYSLLTSKISTVNKSLCHILSLKDQNDLRVLLTFETAKRGSSKNRGETDLETRKKVLYLFDCVDNFTSLATQIWVI